ncbi:MAG: hypothetical protein HOP30_11630 [Cyclobacteriaceae bacterium]|nr:hypothetical protein [Cyclobacteriaceae bacterium]
MRLNRITRFVIVALTALVFSCVPKEQVVFKSINNLVLDGDMGGTPILKGDAQFFNPNKIQTRLKEIKVDVMVDGKKAAEVDQLMDLLIPKQSDFTVPIQAKLSLQDIGLLDAVIGFFGGKKYQVQFVGYIRIVKHGVTIKVPVKYNEEVKLK